MREIGNKKNWSLFSLLMVIVIVAVGYFVLSPIISSLKDLNTNIDAKDAENVQLEQKLLTLNKLKQEFADNPNKLKILNLAVPEENMLAEITESLREIAAQSVINITSIKQVSTQTSKDTNTKIDLTFEGSYTGFKMFLEDLEKNVRLNTPTKISLTSAKNTEGGETYVKGAMTLDFFKTNTAKNSSTSNASATVTSTTEATK